MRNDSLHRPPVGLFGLATTTMSMSPCDGALEHGLFVDREVGQPRNPHDLGARDLRVDAVHRERRRHVEDLAPGPAPCEQHVEDELIATVADQYVLGLEPVGLGDDAPQLVGGRVRVAVELEVLKARLELGDDLGRAG